MSPLVDHTPSPDLTDLVDAVCKLVSAVFDGDLGLAPRQITAIDVSDARHETLIDPECFELAMQSGALHPDEFCGSRDVAAEPADLRDQIFALENLAGIA